MNEIAKLEQKPIIDFSQLEAIGKKVDEDLSVYNFDQLIVTDENVKGIKQLRTRLKKDFELAETVRKEIKKSVNDPYSQFEEKYKEHIANKYKAADISLKKAIDEIENKQKEDKKNEVETYFIELCQANNLDFIKLDNVGLNITLSASLKSLKDQVATFIDSVRSDLELIATQENRERILVEYQRTLNASQSILTVTQAIKQEDELRVRQEEIQAKKAVETPVIKEPVVIEAPTEVEKSITRSMKVTGTKTQLINLINYMKEEGIKYE